MRILFCTHKMNDGGAERVVSLWMKGFSLEGHKVDLAICTSNDRRDYELPKEAKIYNIFPSSRSKTLSFFERIRNLRRVIKTVKPDIIITALGPWGLWAYLASLGLNKVVIHTEHNTFERPLSAPMTKGMYFYKFWVNKLFKAVTVLTEADKTAIGHRLKNVFVMPNPLICEPMGDLSLKEKVVLAAGRLDAWHVKGFDNLMKVWNIVSPNFPEWKLIIAGSGSNETVSFLQGLLDEKVRNRVQFIGFTNDILSWYKKSSIFILSSRYEGFGMVLIEAMSQGCACVSTDYRGRQREILNSDQLGRVCNPDDIQGLAENLTDLLVDEKKRVRMQRASIVRSKDFTLQNIMKNWSVIIDEIL